MKREPGGVTIRSGRTEAGGEEKRSFSEDGKPQAFLTLGRAEGATTSLGTDGVDTQRLARTPLREETDLMVCRHAPA